MTSSHHAPYSLGDTRATMAGTKGQRSREGEITPKPVLSSDCRLQLACMKLESLVIAGQPYGGECSTPGEDFCPNYIGAYRANDFSTTSFFFN
ncbi:hypothetical protein KSP40_PGU000220 [Platanthera guangdongensis]|uniref:Uncharacterized protein n=1 Tax=Platanthera guangdongensis TaxID=2320717 RepID=A0ABR2MI63_9ASPA